MFDKYYRSWAEIDLDSVKNNILGVRKIVGEKTKICGVIKADGYGLGAVPIARAINDLVDFYAVASIDEAINLRTHGITLPIVVLGYVHESGFEYAIKNDIRLAAFDYDTVNKLALKAKLLNKKALVHVKVDTGMHRIGIPCNDRGIEFVKNVKSYEYLELEGMFTHFFLSDAYDKKSAYEQFEKFKGFSEQLEKMGINIPVKHCANSAAALEMPETYMDMVRLGITLYGMYPSDEIISYKVSPVFSLKSHIIMVKNIPEGDTVGYGGNFKALRDSVIATVPIGYADGYRRTISNKGAYVLVRGKRIPIAGRICMDQMMLDITDFNDIETGDVVTLIGKDGNEEITIEEISEFAGTINYEFACGLGRRVPRIYYENGKVVSCKDYIVDQY